MAKPRVSFPLDDLGDDEKPDATRVAQDAATIMLTTLRGESSNVGVYAPGNVWADSHVELVPRRKTPAIISVDREEYRRRLGVLRDCLELMEKAL